MRAAEQTWPEGKRESRDAYLRRLERSAKGIPAQMIDEAIAHMKVRCQRLVAAKGGQIEG